MNSCTEQETKLDKLEKMHCVSCEKRSASWELRDAKARGSLYKCKTHNRVLRASR